MTFETVHVERVKLLDRTDRFVQAPGMADAAIEILMDARSGDAQAAQLEGVSVVITGRGFSGESYGLALAIADKRARAIGSPETEVVATGAIVNRGRGTVAAIKGFAEKAKAIVARAAETDLPIDFAFPRDNWNEADPEVRAFLDAARRDGRLRLWPCSDIDELRALWHVPRRTRPVHVAAAAAVLVALTATAAAGWGYVETRDARACEAAMAPQAPRDRQAIARAVEICERASLAAPDNGRLHHQLGRALALNGSEAQALLEWRKAAEAGDRDGMANYGRALWQNAPQDRAQTARALGWLKRASAAGSVEATRDIGFVLLDGGALPPDPAAAQRWFVKAKAMDESLAGEEGSTE